MKKLEGKTALITGAGAGIGEGIAEVYAGYGAKLCLVGRSANVEDVGERLRRDFGAEVLVCRCDVTDKEGLKQAAAKTVETFGSLDIACCNAGIFQIAPFEEMTDEMRDYHIDVNIKGVWNTCQAVISHMLAQGHGSIVIASSVTGDLVADGGEAAYAMSKAALVGLTRALAVEYADRHIRVNCTQLGYARTPMVEKAARMTAPADPDSVIEGIAAGIPMKRMADPREVGELFAFLGSDESSYMTGSQIVIDGGSTLPETSTMGV